MAMNERQDTTMLRAIAGALTPTTLAAVVADLRADGQPEESLVGRAEYALHRQLICLVGEDEAAALIAAAQ